MQGIYSAFGKFLPVTLLDGPGVLPARFLIQGIPGRQSDLADYISLGQAKGELLPEYLVPHFVERFLHEGAGQLVGGHPVALLDFIEFNNVAKSEMIHLLKDRVFQLFKARKLFLRPGPTVQGCDLGCEADHVDQSAEFFLCEAKMH